MKRTTYLDLVSSQRRFLPSSASPQFIPMAGWLGHDATSAESLQPLNRIAEWCMDTLSIRSVNHNSVNHNKEI